MIVKVRQLGVLDDVWHDAVLEARQLMSSEVSWEDARWTAEVAGQLCVVLVSRIFLATVLHDGALGALAVESHKCGGDAMLVAICGVQGKRDATRAELVMSLNQVQNPHHDRPTTTEADTPAALVDALTRAMRRCGGDASPFGIPGGELGDESPGEFSGESWRNSFV